MGSRWDALSDRPWIHDFGYVSDFILHSLILLGSRVEGSNLQSADQQSAIYRSTYRFLPLPHRGKSTREDLPLLLQVEQVWSRFGATVNSEGESGTTA